jgi:hypothetical protein
VGYRACQCASLRQRGDDLVIFVPCHQRHFTLVELCAVLLKYCRELAAVQCSKAGKAFCITASFSNSRSALRTLAEAAEAAGICSPKVVSAGVALACGYVTRQQGSAYQNNLSLLIMNMSTRGFEIFPVNASHDSKDRPSLLLDGVFVRTFGISVDESMALQLIPKGLPFKYHARRVGIGI